MDKFDSKKLALMFYKHNKSNRLNKKKDKDYLNNIKNNIKEFIEGKIRENANSEDEYFNLVLKYLDENFILNVFINYTEIDNNKIEYTD
jgi:hypothetical protein